MVVFYAEKVRPGSIGRPKAIGLLEFLFDWSTGCTCETGLEGMVA